MSCREELRVVRRSDAGMHSVPSVPRRKTTRLLASSSRKVDLSAARTESRRNVMLLPEHSAVTGSCLACSSYGPRFPCSERARLLLTSIDTGSVCAGHGWSTAVKRMPIDAWSSGRNVSRVVYRARSLVVLLRP